jgi:DNA helicase INO80
MNIWRADWINDSLKKDDGEFGFLKVLDVTAGEAERRAKTHPLVSLLDDAQGEQVRLKEGSIQR